MRREGGSMRRINGQTFKQFARELFEFNYCEECGGDERDHLPAEAMGGWFAYCKPNAVNRAGIDVSPAVITL
jgi:hypothetical protein